MKKVGDKWKKDNSINRKEHTNTLVEQNHYSYTILTYKLLYLQNLYTYKNKEQILQKKVNL